MGEIITDDGYMWMAINHINKEIDILKNENDTLRSERNDYMFERDAYMKSYSDVCEERDTLRKQLNEYEGNNKRWHSFETVQAIVKEREELQGKLDITVKEIRMPIDNPERYRPEVINWSKYLLRIIEKTGIKKMNELCSVCGHPYDSHGSHSWCENKPCDCERIPIVDELYEQVEELQEELYPLQVKLDITISERDTLRKEIDKQGTDLGNAILETMQLRKQLEESEESNKLTIIALQETDKQIDTLHKQLSLRDYKYVELASINDELKRKLDIAVEAMERGKSVSDSNNDGVTYDILNDALVEIEKVKGE